MHQLPGGTLTLLFTDIEGSTRLLRHVGDRYAEVLAECRRLLRQMFHEYDGHEVDSQGDAFFVAFARATDAVEAAVAAQRAVAQYSWPEGVVLRVRMGMHTGEPEQSTEGYVGLDVHYAARIMSAGHGGQVLLSQTTRELVAHALPEGVRLADLGTHRLKDLQQPSHLFQLVIAGLPVDFPPLKTLDVSPNNLPVQPTTFIGREQEVAAVAALLNREDLRLVTLTGPGGTGKTRLGLQVAAELSEAFTDGVFFVNLAPTRDPAFVLPAIAQTLDVKEMGALTLLDLLRASLREKHLLLLLDNFEQVVQAAPQIAALLVACPKLKIIVTSRMALHVRAEQEFAVPPLALPDPERLLGPVALAQYEAVALFIMRAQAVRPAFEVTTATAPAIAEICIRLDGLPLAIELAATRVNVLPPQALLARLSTRLLTGGARDAPARQQTLRNTLAWSYGLLTIAEQRLFCQLAAFRGGCTLEAVEALVSVLGDPPADVLDTLASLVDKSLLRQATDEGEEPRFAMLETIREYGLEELAAKGELERTKQAHAAYFLELAEQAEPGLKGPEQIKWLRRLERDHNNLRAALEWLLSQGGVGPALEQALRLGSALREFWDIHGHFGEGRTLLERALARAETINPSMRSKALVAAGWLAHAQGDYAGAETLGQEGLTLARELGDPHHIAVALQLLGSTVWFRDLGLANALTEESLALGRAIGDSWVVAWSIFILGNLVALQGKQAEARSLLEECLAIYRGIGNPKYITATLLILGGELAADHPARSRALLEEGLALTRDMGDKRNMAMVLGSLGWLLLEQGETATVAPLAEESLRLSKELGHMLSVASALTLLGDLAAALGDYALARTRYEESLALMQEGTSPEPQTLLANLEGLALVVAAQGEPVWAARLWGAAEAVREARSFPLPQGHLDRYERARATARVQLGERAFAAAWAEGRTMSLEQVLAAPESGTTPQPGTASTSSFSPGKRVPTYPDGLTAREVEVLRLVAQGLTNEQAAEQLVISPRTVNTHLTAIYGKIGVSSRSAATRYAIEHHLI